MKKNEGCSELTSRGSAEDTLLLQDKIRESSVMEREMTGEIILYQPDATLSLQVELDAAHDTVWLATSQMSQLFGKDESTIRRHILHIFDEEELPKDNNVHFLHVNGRKKACAFLFNRCYNWVRVRNDFFILCVQFIVFNSKCTL
ncbi:MAG: hypothetical protein MJZ73_05685 [Bacteroidaceae bacterium]|nr:hypothetical protein [Bacteroidaceae bacterium]